MQGHSRHWQTLHEASRDDETTTVVRFRSVRPVYVILVDFHLGAGHPARGYYTTSFTYRIEQRPSS